MRLETIPLILGALIGLVGIGLILDAWLKDEIIIKKERRRRPRRERDRLGEALVGFGVLAMAAAFMGRDSWRYSTVAVIAGAVLLLWGAKRSSAYMRGALSRQAPEAPKPAEPPPPPPPREFAPGARRVR
jgi:hypothetical protein